MSTSQFQQELKEAVKQKHGEAENNPLMQGILSGKFEKKDLLRFYANIRPFYYVVEQRLLQQYILNNKDLLRTPNIDKDIEVLSKDFSNEELADILTPLEITDLWVGWCWTKPKDFLKADLYVRWLADLFGGSYMARSLGEYAKTYQFEDPEKTKGAVREIVDSPSDVDRDDIKDEAVECFDFHINLFNAILNK